MPSAGREPADDKPTQTIDDYDAEERQYQHRQAGPRLYTPVDSTSGPDTDE